MDTSIESLLHGGICEVPQDVAVCPECGGKLTVDCNEWNAGTGFPIESGFSLSCEAEEELLDDWVGDDTDLRHINEVGHRHWQSDWQPVRDRVWEWIESKRKELISEEIRKSDD